MRIDSPVIPAGHGISSRTERLQSDAVVLHPNEHAGGSELKEQRRASPALNLMLESSWREHDSLDNVPPRNRAAVSAYLANQPSAIERLGVELVGVDEIV